VQSEDSVAFDELSDLSYDSEGNEKIKPKVIA
jgi:hypothetical protein